MTIAAVVLAAGGSKRLGFAKQLVRLDGETLVNRAARLAREAGADPVVVVLGARFAEIREAVSLEDVVVVRNEAWEQGIASSVRAGVDFVEKNVPDATGVLLLTCDQTALTAEHLCALLARFAESGGMVASRYAGTRGTPAVFPREAFGRLCALEGDTGARSILMCAPSVTDVELPDGAADVDWPEDAARLD